MTLEKLMAELQYEIGIRQAVQWKICEDVSLVKEIAEIAYHGEKFNFLLCKRMPLTRLAVVTYLLLRKYDDYKSKKIPDSIIYDTFRDVSFRAKLYYNRTDRVGISKDDVIWFRHIMNVNIFKVGTLQFQPFEMLYLDEEGIGEPYMTFTMEQKAALPAGTPVLNCHIPQGADLRDQPVEESLDDAKVFFSKYFPNVQYKAFLCYSWLLYPPMLQHLSNESNIQQFAKRFHIIGFCNDSEQAMENLWGNVNSNIPCEITSLQKMAAEHKERFGFACGIISI